MDQLPWASSCLVGKLVLGHFCPWTERGLKCVLAYKTSPVLAKICPGGQVQRELLSSETLLRVELCISELSAGA